MIITTFMSTSATKLLLFSSFRPFSQMKMITTINNKTKYVQIENLVLRSRSYLPHSFYPISTWKYNCIFVIVHVFSEQLPWIPHSCYVGDHCEPSIGSCIKYTEIRECCCDRVLAKRCSYIYTELFSIL